MSHSFSENRLLAQRFESGSSADRGPETGIGGFFSSILGQARGLLGRLSPSGNSALRGTVDRFGRDFNAVRSGVARDVRRDLPPAVRDTPQADAAFKSAGNDSMAKMLQDFQRESAALDQQRDKVFADSLAKLEALKQQMEKDEAAEEAGTKVAAAPAVAPAVNTGTTVIPPLPRASTGPTEFPTTPEAIRERFRYTPDRFGTPEGYSRFLAEQLNTDERWNQFLQAMYEFTETTPGIPAEVLNLNNLRDTDPWVPPLRFMTTYNSNGKMFGDCEDLAFFATHIARLQGKSAFSAGIGSNVGERRTDGTFRLRADGGHVFTGWFEPGTGGRRVLKLVTTRGINTAAGAPIGQAGMFTATANAGESDAQLLTRLYNEVAGVSTTVPVGVRTLDTNHLQAMHVLTSGNGFIVHGNFNLLARHGELEALLQRTPPDHMGVVRIVREEIANDQNNLGLHASLVQFLLLANERTAVDPALDGLLAAMRISAPVSRNIVTVSALRDSLMAAGINGPKTQELDRIVRTWIEGNVRPA